MPAHNIELARMTYRVVKIIETEEDESYEITLKRNDKQVTVFVDNDHIARGMSIGSTIEMSIEAPV